MAVSGARAIHQFIAQILSEIKDYHPSHSARCIITAAARRKEHPLSMRLAEADIAVTDRAAASRGRSRTDLMREAPVRAVLIGGRAAVVNALDEVAARLWRRWEFVTSRDDPLVLFRPIQDVAASLAEANEYGGLPVSFSAIRASPRYRRRTPLGRDVVECVPELGYTFPQIV